MYFTLLNEQCEKAVNPYCLLRTLQGLLGTVLGIDLTMNEEEKTFFKLRLFLDSRQNAAECLR